MHHCLSRIGSAGLLVVFAAAAFGQPNILTVTPPDRLMVKAGTMAEVKLAVQLRDGYHANSNAPMDEYLIPMKLTWSKTGFDAGEILYPKPQLEKYSFSDKPLSVYTGSFEITTRFKIDKDVFPGPSILSGKLRYQACTDRMCFQPKTVDISLPVDITK